MWRLPLTASPTQFAQRTTQRLASEDAKGIALAAHSLKGSAGYFGAGELQSLCKEIETWADSGALDAIRRTLPTLHSVIEATIAPLRRGTDGANTAD